jgi:hypothetical protein
MKKHRLNTTISEKHHSILKKHVDEFGTQQKVLENALECFENNGDQNHKLSYEEEVWMRIGREIKEVQMLLQKDFIKLLFETADMEQFKEYMEKEKPSEFALEWFLQKPLKEFTLEELIDTVLLKIRIQGGFDTIRCNEDKNSYNINLTHNMGINCSKMNIIMYDGLFKSYGVKSDSNYSHRSVFFKVYK